MIFRMWVVRWWHWVVMWQVWWHCERKFGIVSCPIRVCGECEGSHPSDEACMFCRPPSGEAESVGPEQGFTQTVAQASPQPLTTQYCRRRGSSSSSSMIVRQCQQQRVFASWGWVWSGPRSPHSTAELYTNCRILSHCTCLNPSAVPSNMSLREYVICPVFRLSMPCGTLYA